jgi:coenzyme Q-binding protein COQ10
MKIRATSRYDCGQLFALVADIEHYPDFLPHWRSTHIRQRTETTILVHQVIRVAGLDLAFDSCATLQQPFQITIAAEGGIFRLFEMHWRFYSCANNGCEVHFETRLALRNRILETLISPVLARQQRQIVRCFELEADRRYGRGASGD